MLIFIDRWMVLGLIFILLHFVIMGSLSALYSRMESFLCWYSKLHRFCRLFNFYGICFCSFDEITPLLLLLHFCTNSRNDEGMDYIFQHTTANKVPNSNDYCLYQRSCSVSGNSNRVSVGFGVYILQNGGWKGEFYFIWRPGI